MIMNRPPAWVLEHGSDRKLIIHKQWPTSLPHLIISLLTTLTSSHKAFLLNSHSSQKSSSPSSFPHLSSSIPRLYSSLVHLFSSLLMSFVSLVLFMSCSTLTHASLSVISLSLFISLTHLFSSVKYRHTQHFV